MKCLPPTVMNNYVTCFRMLTHLGVNNIWATGVLSKNRLRKCTIVGDKQPQKRNVDTLDSTHQAKKAVQLWQWLFWTTTERCTLILLNFLNLRDLFGVWIKLKESIFKNNHQINSTVTTRTWVLFDRMDVSKYKIVIRMKKWSWFPFAYIVDVFLQNALVLYHINKDEGDESLPLLAWNFS